MKSKLYITTSEDYIDKSKMIIKKENGDYIKQEGSYIFFEDNLGKTKKSSGNIQNIITNLYRGIEIYNYILN